ncbi:MAG: aspartyl protease family protein [Ferruginibacter sp.]
MALFFRRLLFGLLVLVPSFLLAQAVKPPLTQSTFRMLSGGVVLLAVQLEGIPDTLHFILDSGSGSVSLDADRCQSYGWQTAVSDTIVQGIGGTGNRYLTESKSIRLNGFAFPPMLFRVQDYSNLSAVYGERIDGILGYPWFRLHAVLLDFDANNLQVFPSESVVYPEGGALFPIQPNPLPRGLFRVRDKFKKQVPLYWDSGAGLALLLDEQLVKDSMLLMSHRKKRFTQLEGMGGKRQMQLTVIRSLQVGPWTFERVPTYLFRDADKVIGYPKTGGLIGNELLRRFQVIFNYPAGQLWLKPNRHFADPFEYGYSGFSIYLMDDRILVDDVIPGSPAEKAGLKNGDEVIGVDGDFSGDLQQYKNLFQDPDRDMKIMLRREAAVLQVLLHTERIY